MTKVDQIIELVNTMTRADRSEVLHRLQLDVVEIRGSVEPAAAKSNRILKTAGVAGGHACIRQTRIAVWTLVQLKKLGRSEDDLLCDFVGLERSDLDAAWDYYRRHTIEIDTAIMQQSRIDW